MTLSQLIQEAEKEFVDEFIADDILDCIPEKNWEEMKGEVFAFLTSYIKKGYEVGQKNCGICRLPWLKNEK